MKSKRKYINMSKKYKITKSKYLKCTKNKMDFWEKQQKFQKINENNEKNIDILLKRE